MVDRVAAEFQLQDPGQARAAEVNLGVGQYRPEAPETSIGEQALGALLNVGQQFAGKAVDQAAQEAYLEGGRARLAGDAEAVLDADPLSRAFVRGGYNDEDYRIRQVDMERRLKTVIANNGQRMQPNEFAALMREESGKVTEGFGSLTMNGRLRALAAQRSMESSLITEQAGAYQKWSIGEGLKRVTAQGNQIMNSLLASPDEGTRAANQERAALYYSDILSSDKLPEATRQEYATNYLLALANADQRDVVENLRDSGALDSLPLDQRRQLDTALRESSTRTLAKDALGVVMANGDFEARVDTGQVSTEELQAYIETETLAKRMTYTQGKALRMRAATGLANKDDTQSVMQALGARDLNQLAALGFTGKDAVELMDKQLAANGTGLSERIRAGLSVGLDIGQLPKSFGETVAAGVRSIQATGTDDPQNAQLVDALNNVTGTLTLAEQRQPGARAVLLDAMPDDTKQAMAYMLRQSQAGVPPAQALREYAVNRDAFAKLTNVEQGMKTAEFRKQLSTKVDGAVRTGLFGELGNLLINRPNLSENPASVAVMSGAVQEELDWLLGDRNNAGTTPEALLDVAMSAVKARTVEVGGGALSGDFLGGGTPRRQLVLPRGMRVADVFGTDDAQRIGRVLSEQYPDTVDGFEQHFRYDRYGRGLEAVQINENGQIVDRKPIDVGGITRTVIDQQRTAAEEGERAMFGGPIEVSGQELGITGGNVAGLPVRNVYRFRQELAELEGLRLEVYADRDGLAAGVGRNVTRSGMKAGDTISKEQAEQWFEEDTNAALGVGKRAAAELGVRDTTAVMALAGAAYQLGEAGWREHKRTAEAIANRDYNAFLQEVRSSKWAEQTPKRAEWFISRMAGHFVQ